MLGAGIGWFGRFEFNAGSALAANGAAAYQLNEPAGRPLACGRDTDRSRP
ncbi:hypothetical protein [Candidatus Poriferisodalis sp.]